MARVKSELEAAGTPTGATRQLNIEREAGLESKVAPTAKLPTGRAPTAAETTPSKAPVTAAGAFVDLVRQKTQEKITAKREELLNAPDNYDTQVALQRGTLYEALAEGATALTPEKLRWLSPDQQDAIRSDDKGLIKNSIIGLNSILQFRKDARDEEDAKKEKEDAKRLAQAETTYGIYKDLGFEKLTDVQRASLETTLGLPSGTLLTFAEDKTNGIDWELGTDVNGNKIKYRFDPYSGLYSSEVIEYKPKTPKQSDDAKDEKAFKDDAYDVLLQVGSGDISIEDATAALASKYGYDRALVRGYLTDNWPSSSQSSLGSAVAGFYGFCK